MYISYSVWMDSYTRIVNSAQHTTTNISDQNYFLQINCIKFCDEYITEHLTIVQ